MPRVTKLDGYTFEVSHDMFTVPEDLPPQPPGQPQPGDEISVHTLSFLGWLAPGLLGEVVQVDLPDRGRDELIRQLQGGEPPKANAGLVVAGAEALRHLPGQRNQGGR